VRCCMKNCGLRNSPACDRSRRDQARPGAGQIPLPVEVVKFAQALVKKRIEALARKLNCGVTPTVSHS